MNIIISLIRRNIKLFFHDKGLFFTSLITPMILLMLYATFLGNVYKESFISNIPDGVKLPDSLIEGCVAGQLLSSLLAVSCVTVAFSSNMLMVQDKYKGARRDLSIAPVKSSQLALAYYASAFLSTLIIAFTALCAGLAYTASQGWYLTPGDVAALAGDVLLLSLFGTALSSIVNSFLSTEGQVSAVGTIVSSAYGFICGAYMPISQFGSGLQTVISFLPGTYGTALLREHAMGSAIESFADYGFSQEAISSMRGALDCQIEFMGSIVSQGGMYIILTASICALIALFVIINRLRHS